MRKPAFLSNERLSRFLVSLLLTMGLVHALTEWVGLFFMVSKIIATLIVLVWNFVARKLLLYRKAPQ